MKKVLFITQSYPSARSANVLCDDMIIQRLLATREAEVHCLCMRYHDQPLDEVIDGLHVHRFRMGPYFEFKDAALSKPGSFADRFIRVFDRLVLRLNQILTIPIYPCFYPFRTRKFIQEAKHLQKRYAFDVVACEHYGYETMMAGFNLKKQHPEVRYLQFFWDALSGGTKPGYLPRHFIDKRRERLESEIFTAADCSVAMTSHRDHLADKMYAQSAEKDGRLRFFGIPYLQRVQVDSNTRCSLRFDTSKTNIVFAGNLWGRNINYAASLINEVKGLDIVLWIITSSDTAGLEQIMSGIGERIKLVPYMEHGELLSVLANADALLNMGVKNPNAISGKIFEYMGCCKPIISTYPIDNEACLPILKRYQLALLLDERERDIPLQASKLKHFLVKNVDKEIDYQDVESMFSDCTPEAYCELFNLPLKQDSARE